MHDFLYRKLYIQQLKNFNHFLHTSYWKQLYNKVCICIESQCMLSFLSYIDRLSSKYPPKLASMSICLSQYYFAYKHIFYLLYIRDATALRNPNLLHKLTAIFLKQNMHKKVNIVSFKVTFQSDFTYLENTGFRIQERTWLDIDMSCY